MTRRTNAHWFTIAMCLVVVCMCIVCMHLCVCLVCSLWFTVTMSNGFIEVYGFWHCFIASTILFPTNSSVLVCLSSVYHCICVAYRFCGPTVQMKFRTEPEAPTVQTAMTLASTNQNQVGKVQGLPCAVSGGNEGAATSSGENSCSSWCRRTLPLLWPPSDSSSILINTWNESKQAATLWVRFRAQL